MPNQKKAMYVTLPMKAMSLKHMKITHNSCHNQIKEVH